MFSNLKLSKVSGQLLLRDSLDSNVSSANTEVTDGKWHASEAIEDAESRLMNASRLMNVQARNY